MNIECILSEIEQKLIQFNKTKKEKIYLLLKGSYILNKFNLIKREINDLDFCLLKNTRHTLVLELVEFIKSQKEWKFKSFDNNLIIFYCGNLKIEIVTLETYGDEMTIPSDYSYIKNIDINLAIFSKIMSLTYILSNYFSNNKNNNQNEKVEQTINDLFEINKRINLQTILNNGEFEKYHSDRLWNSFFIYLNYNYDFYIEKEKLQNLSDFNLNTSNKFINNILKIIDKFRIFNKENIDILDLVLKRKDKFLSLTAEMFNQPSLSGLEKFIFNDFFKNTKIIKNNRFHKANKNKILLLAHADEVGGLIINKKVYNVGTMNWENDSLYSIFNLDNVLIQTSKGESLKNYLYSAEKQRKINRPNLKIWNTNELKNNEIYQVISSTPFLVNGWILISRNFDNKINLSILKLLENECNFLLTSKEEIQLQGIKELKNSNFLKSYKYLINLEVSEDDLWDTDKILIRAADTFTAIDSNSIKWVKSIFDKNKIPYEFFYGSGSTDITELQHLKNISITLSLPSDKIHSTKSKIYFKNLFYIFFFILKIYKNENYLKNESN